jgi:hypothetical protein
MRTHHCRRSGETMSDIDDMARKIHLNAVEHGFWDKDRNLGEMLMLATSELAECLEENRNSKPAVYWKCKECGRELSGKHTHTSKMTSVCHGTLKPEGELVEIIDAIIRLLDTGQHIANQNGYELSAILDMKMRYNDTREYKHGKEY